MLKQLVSSMLVLSVCAAHAGTMGVASPCHQWQIGGHALYLEALFGDYSYNGNYSQEISGNYTSNDYSVFSPQWAWGFDLEASYLFNQSNDIKFSWAHYGHQNNYTYGPQILAGSTSSVSTSDNESVSPNWHWANVEFGQSLQFNEHSKARLFAGVEYTRIAFSKLVLQNLTTGESRTVNQALSFNGFGPRVGLDLSYSFTPCLGIYGVGGFGLPVGSQSYNTTRTTSTVIYNHISNTGLVPEIDVKLGAQYNHTLTQGTLSADVGWMWINYFNSTLYLQSLNATLRNPRQANFSLTGLYFGLKWTGDALV